MNRLFGLFLTFFIVFGLIGSVFGGQFASTTSNPVQNQLTTSSDGLNSINFLNLGTFDLVKSEKTDELLYKNKDSGYYIDSNGAKVNKNGYYIGIFGGIISNKNDIIYSGNVESFIDRKSSILKNPNLGFLLEIEQYKKDKLKLNWNPVYSNLETTSNALDECKKTIGANCDLKLDSFNKAESFAMLNTDINSVLNSMTPNQQKVYLKSYNKQNNQCNIGFGLDGICNLFSRQNVNDLALISYQTQINNLRKSDAVLKLKQNIDIAKQELGKFGNGCQININQVNCDLNKKKKIEELKKNLDLAEKIYTQYFNEKQIKIALNGLPENVKSQFSVDCNSNPTVCFNSIKKSSFCKNKDNSQLCSQLKSKLNLAKDQQLVQTNTFYDIMNTLANPDFDALNAAKLFGFEPNYANVPKMLKTPIASQICSAKISGYLDKDRTNSGGGVTSYGCDKTITENYDVNTGIYVNSDANCLKVLLDFRAQRAQITPDNKVAITYSLYLKAPPKINIKYFLAIKYLLKDTSTKKQLLKPNKNIFEFTGAGGVAKQYATVYIPLNISRDLVLDSKISFSLSILAKYPDGRIYQHKTIPIILISATDSYVGILAGNGVSSGSLNSVRGASSPTPLTPADMLAMI